MGEARARVVARARRRFRDWRTAAGLEAEEGSWEVQEVVSEGISSMGEAATRRAMGEWRGDGGVWMGLECTCTWRWGGRNATRGRGWSEADAEETERAWRSVVRAVAV